MSKGIVLNLTDLTVSEVDWPGEPALFEAGGTRVMQIHVYSPTYMQWVKIVPKAYQEEGCIVVTPGNMLDIGVLKNSGMDNIEAVKQVTGMSIAQLVF